MRSQFKKKSEKRNDKKTFNANCDVFQTCDCNGCDCNGCDVDCNNCGDICGRICDCIGNLLCGFLDC